MKIIIAPTDFSEISLNAVNYAADLACVIGTNLSLLHVCQIPVSFSEVPTPVYDIDKQVEDAEEQIRLLKEKVIYRTGDRIKIFTEVRQGSLLPEIIEYCELMDPYAVVMGVETTSAFERFLVGGKTTSAVHQLLFPIIAVPPGVNFDSIRKIGLACDFRDVRASIPVKEIRTLVQGFNAELHVLHVSPEKGSSFNTTTVVESQWLQDLLGEMNPRYDFINGTDIEQGIIDFSDRNDLDLLIVIPKKHNIFSRLFKHSHSKDLVLHTHVPVMAIHE